VCQRPRRKTGPVFLPPSRPALRPLSRGRALDPASRDLGWVSGLKRDWISLAASCLSLSYYLTSSGGNCAWLQCV